jgi:xanthine dehydrogenase accessory factor
MSQPIESPPARRVLVLGNTPIARAVAGVGAAAGYEIGPFDASTLDGVEAVVLASHGGPDEDAALRAALAAGVPYIGLVASRARGEGVVTGLGLEAAETTRIHTPAGLDIGAGTPEEVALAILAEVVASRPRLPGQSRAARGKRTCDHRESAS